MREPRELEWRRMAGRALVSHPDGPSAWDEAGHWQVLAEHSAAEVMRTFRVMQLARHGYEDLHRRLDPRHTRTVHFAVATLLLAGVFVILVLLDAIEFAGVLTGWVTSAAVAAAAAWTGCAWLAALAIRERSHGHLGAIIGGVVTSGLLLAGLHASGIAPGRVGWWYPFGVGTMAVLLIFALVAVATVLIARTEPASLLLVRRRWHQARAAHAAALRVHERDAEADVVARQGWRNLVLAHTEGARRPISRENQNGARQGG